MNLFTISGDKVKELDVALYNEGRVCLTVLEDDALDGVKRDYVFIRLTVGAFSQYRLYIEEYVDEKKRTLDEIGAGSLEQLFLNLPLEHLGGLIATLMKK